MTSRLLAAALLLVLLTALAGARAESGRIKHSRPSVDEEQRALSDAVMNDGSLQVGDIVVTNHGYFVFDGIAEDGFTNRFRAIADPLARSSSSPSKRPAR